MITPAVLIISLFLSTTWGIYLVSSINAYRAVRLDPHRRRGEAVTALRRVVVAFCVWLICFAYVFRTACILLGVGDLVISQVTFFALLGSNIAGSLFAVVSLRYD